MRRAHLSAATVVAGLALMGFQPAPRAPQPKPQPSPTALPAIEGVVRGPDGKAVEGAVVLAQAVGGRLDSVPPWAVPDPPSSTRSDAEGRFRLKARAKRPHTLRVEAKGLASRTLEKVIPGRPLEIALRRGAAIEGLIRDGRTADPIANATVEAREAEGTLLLPGDPRIGAKEATSDAKGRYRLEGLAPGIHSVAASARGYGRASRAGIASGAKLDLYLFPGSSITGGVSDGEGKPVKGAVVRAESDRLTGPAPRAEVTAADGQFVLAGLEPATYRVVTRHRDYAPSVVSGVSVRPESESQADVVLSRGGGVTGKLVDPEGQPLLGRATVVELRGRPALRSLGDLLTAETGADGRFLLSSVPEGAHALSVAAPGFAAVRVEIHVREGDQTDAGDIVLTTGPGIRGTVKDRLGQPIAEAAVMASRGPGLETTPPVQAAVKADGAFALVGLSPGRYSLMATAAGFSSAIKSADTGAEDVELVLQPVGTISGTAVDEAGRAIESFGVTARGAAPATPSQPRSFGSKSFGDPEGRFLLEVRGEGEHVVQVTAPNHAMSVVPGVIVAAGQTVEIGRIRLSAGGVVRGHVVDAGGAAVPGATVTIRGAGRDFGTIPEAASDETGRFEIKGVAAGTVDVLAVHPSFVEGRVSGLEIDPAKEPVESRIVMVRGGRVEGLVTKRDGSGIAGMMIDFSPSSVGPTRPSSLRTFTGDDGSFSIDHVPTGRAHVALMGRSGTVYLSLQSRQIDILEGETASVQFSSREVLLSGRISRNSRPAPGLRLQLMGRGGNTMIVGSGAEAAPTPGRQHLNAVSDAGGRFELILNEAGKFLVTIDSVDGRGSLPMRTVDVPDVDAHVLDMDFSGVPLTGIVIDEETSQPIADARVSARLQKPGPGGSSGSGGSTSSDERFQFDVEPGEYRVGASAQGYLSESIDLAVEASGASDVRIALARGAAIQGRVVDDRDRGVAMVNVFASSPPETGATLESSGSSGGSRTQADGSFLIEGLAPRTHLVTVRTSVGDYGLVAGVSPGDKDVVLTMRRGARITVRTVGADGNPLAGASLRVDRVNDIALVGQNLASGQTDATGATELHVPSGSIVLRATKGKLSTETTLTVAERGTTAIELRLVEPEARKLP